MDLKEEVNFSCPPYWFHFVQPNGGKHIDFGAEDSSDVQLIAVLHPVTLLLFKLKLQELIPKPIYKWQSKCPAALRK